VKFIDEASEGQRPGALNIDAVHVGMFDCNSEVDVGDAGKIPPQLKNGGCLQKLRPKCAAIPIARLQLVGCLRQRKPREKLPHGSAHDGPPVVTQGPTTTTTTYTYTYTEPTPTYVEPAPPVVVYEHRERGPGVYLDTPVLNFGIGFH